MPEEAANPRPEIQVDDDWKERVRAEAAALDAQTPSPEMPAEAKEEPPSKPMRAREEMRLPAADFSMLVQMFSVQAMVALGILPDPSGEAPAAQPEVARHFIDLLSVLETKTKGNLTPREADELTSALHSLRMAYLEVSRG